MNTVYTYIGEDDCIVKASYSPGRPGRNYIPNGDPGYPDEPAELEICSVVVNGREVDYSEYTEAEWDSLQQRLEEMAVDAAAERRAEAAEARGYERVYGSMGDM